MHRLDAHELTHPAAQFVDHLEHQLVVVVVDGVEELPQFLDGEVSYDLAESFIFLLGCNGRHAPVQM